ncbi:MurR/RpiR family transcriptional regulator [Aquibium sp. A9E412]|uniref:MurR/RpiR family transcriptional regulator n=1 Tax=Aquibium sp. A9E412 TaxID=2976767 RepID=UPI0025B22096|nr:MurR/RpiR family transcriptional regulator [Aquibium sp. A9E412]MDN2567764.1 MurR/RpiR family transcriptional regulator [Aquibium sp. A9E412]
MTLESVTDGGPTLDDLRRRLSALSRDAAPEVARLADWMLEQPQEAAFHSVRGLAERAGVNANTVVRLSQALGFEGFEACRGAFQEALRQRSDLYSSRAARLRGSERDAIFRAVRAASHQAIDALFEADTLAAIERAADMLLQARQVHCVGVRSCQALAHYLAYTGGMAFPNFAARMTGPGDIHDLISETGTADVVVAITFSLYSVETVRAFELAKRQGARTIAITDGFRSPIAAGADLVLTPPMFGPQALPSLIAAFAMAEVLIAAMVARSDRALERIAGFETRLLDSGAYVR